LAGESKNNIEKKKASQGSLNYEVSAHQGGGIKSTP